MHKILIVEDERDIADLIGFNLERHGYSILKAHDGIAGTEMALRERPDLIVLDLMLPGRDGYGVFKELRRDARTAQIPVIMLTDKTGAKETMTGLKAGADDYIPKDIFAAEHLMDTLRELGVLE